MGWDSFHIQHPSVPQVCSSTWKKSR